MIVAGLIEILLVGSMHSCVVFASCDLEVGDPSKFTIDITLLST